MVKKNWSIDTYPKTLAQLDIFQNYEIKFLKPGSNSLVNSQISNLKTF